MIMNGNFGRNCLLCVFQLVLVSDCLASIEWNLNLGLGNMH